MTVLIFGLTGDKINLSAQSPRGWGRIRARRVRDLSLLPNSYGRTQLSSALVRALAENRRHPAQLKSVNALVEAVKGMQT
jgi:hypothetical protein